jgi:hypothetical protein
VTSTLRLANRSAAETRHRHFSLDIPPRFCEECGKDWTLVMDGRAGRSSRRQRGPLSLEDRFWQKVDKTDKCWEWTGALTGYGYGTVSRVIDGKRRQLMAHRMAYEIAVGPIPEGLTIDHLCRNKKCVRPDHLEPVTITDNVLRAIVQPLYCPKGHRYEDRRNTRGDRVCAVCIQLKNRRYYAVESERLGRVPHNRNKTHCIRGHDLSGPDVRIDRNGRRQCRACERERYHAEKGA